ncbi:DegT/DnrJ/EryC1/StrS family aminotransferase [Candidatus Albibeggiatoa sp. nov. BB20]|uniref:DegT/DnrJ/EryC1/StrS family aminotransferase n=1 Tax=Candidatus Albibeggiatoa sp. nov. BB20 TaxID=3162723 RepID=UPI003365319A
MSSQKINLHIPDMPSTRELIPWLEQIEANRWYANFGKLNHAFESKLNQQFDKHSHVVTTANATLGLELALIALNLPKNAQILIPSFTFVATATAVLRAGLRPLFADINVNTWSLTPALTYDAIQKNNVAAILPVSAFGYPQAVDQWDIFTQKTGIPVLIDAAGAYGNQAIGKTTSIVFSLHATKTLGIGEGGLVVSNDTALIQKIRQLTNFGINDCKSEFIGTNAKLSEYHAAVGLAALERWSHTQQHRQRLVQTYQYHLDRLDLPIVYQTQNLNKIIWSAFVLRFPTSEDVIELGQFLQQRNITTRRWYYPPLFEHVAFQNIAHAGELLTTRKISPQLLGLPFHHFLTEEDIESVCKSLQAYFK